MSVKVAINGFGRIGRLVLRAMIESGRDDVDAGRDQRSRQRRGQRPSVPLRQRARPLSRRRSRCPATTITIRHGGRVYGPIRVSAERDPTKVPYQGVDVALECTGHLHQQGEGLRADRRPARARC